MATIINVCALNNGGRSTWLSQLGRDRIKFIWKYAIPKGKSAPEGKQFLECLFRSIFRNQAALIYLNSIDINKIMEKVGQSPKTFAIFDSFRDVPFRNWNDQIIKAVGGPTVFDRNETFANLCKQYPSERFASLKDTLQHPVEIILCDDGSFEYTQDLKTSFPNSKIYNFIVAPFDRLNEITDEMLTQTDIIIIGDAPEGANPDKIEIIW